MKSVLRVLTAVLMVVVPTVEATAPATVAPGAAFDIVVDPAPGTVPSDVNGNPVKEIKNITLKIPAPTNATLATTPDLPTITAHLTAGQSGTVESTLYGAGYDAPGLDLTVVVGSIIGDVDAPTACVPNPNPVLSTTTIG